MKIGIDGRLWNETGVGRYTRALVSNLQVIDNTNEYTLFLRRKDYEKVQLISEKWQKVEADIRWHTFSEQILLPTIFSKAKVDLLHIPYFSVPVFTQTPFVVTIHDLTISRFATGRATTKSWIEYRMKRFGYKLVLDNAIKRSKKIITVSQSVKDDITSQFDIDPAKIVVVYESGELEKLNTDTRLKKRLPKNYIVYVGNAHPHKNIETLVLAFKQLSLKFRDLKLILVGKNDYFYKRLKKFVDTHKLSAHVLFLGEVTNTQLGYIYNHAQCFVFPSFSEGFGIPGLEAMDNGCPVVASDIPVFREIYQDAVSYFSPYHSEQMAHQIVKVLTDKTLKDTLIKKGKKRVTLFSWRKMAKETRAIYESCTSI